MDLDRELIDRLRAGDEQAFVILVPRYHDAMVRAGVVVRAVDGCGGGSGSGHLGRRAARDWRLRGTLLVQTWIFHILVNRARSTGAR
ncbi:MAG: RNA polymerase sigma factor, partial [Actinomycetota bacterium]